MDADYPVSASAPIWELSASFFPQLNWSKKLLGASAKCWSDLVFFSGNRLQAEAELVRRLAAAEDPADFFKCQAQFVQASWADYLKEWPKVLELPRALGITD